MGMDDLLTDHYNEQNKSVECKKKKKPKNYSSDEEDNANQAAKENKIAEVLNDASSKVPTFCLNFFMGLSRLLQSEFILSCVFWCQYEEMKSEEEASPWDVPVFQKMVP